MHVKVFEYLKPSDDQLQDMTELREAAANYADVIEMTVPDGPDKTYIMRLLRSVAMWVNVAVTRNADGSPRE